MFHFQSTPDMTYEEIDGWKTVVRIAIYDRQIINLVQCFPALHLSKCWHISCMEFNYNDVTIQAFQK